MKATMLLVAEANQKFESKSQQEMVLLRRTFRCW